MRILVAALLLIVGSTAGAGQHVAAGDEASVRRAIAAWYEELAKKDEGRIRTIVAPGFITSTPHERYIDTGAASLGPRVQTSLAATALKFTYDIETVRIDPNFAKASVWERGYFYAWAAQKTYERTAATVLVLERQERDGRWLILAHQAASAGIPPGKATDPMPDLRDLFYATEGKDRDPAADAREATRF